MTKLLKHIKSSAVVFIGCFFIYSCENSVQEMRALGTKKTGVEEAVNIESLFNQGGKLKAKLNAPVMLRYQIDTPKTEFPQTLRVEFYDAQTKVESRLFAKYGVYIDNQSKVFLRDSVIVFNVKGDTLKTTELWWDQEKQLFYTDKPVHIRKPDQTINGVGMQSDQAFKNITIFKITNTSLAVPDSTMPK